MSNPGISPNETNRTTLDDIASQIKDEPTRHFARKIAGSALLRSDGTPIGDFRGNRPDLLGAGYRSTAPAWQEPEDGDVKDNSFRSFVKYYPMTIMYWLSL
jgi:hypothetical protein